MKFLKAGNNMLSETFGAIEDTAKMIRGATKAGVVHTSAWEDTAKMQVQQAKLENANKFMKKMDKLMDKIDADSTKLYALYGANLPDMRGMFIRGWDNGRGIDSGREILTTQADAIQNITGSLGSIRRYTNSTTENLTGAFWADGAMGSGSITGAGGTGYPSIGFDTSRVARTASETRPYNIAWNYIVKAG